VDGRASSFGDDLDFLERHTDTVVHFVGAPEDLDELARASLGVGLADITGAFSRPA
jgi:hypothetical protein